MRKLIAALLLCSLGSMSVFAHGNDKHFQQQQDVTFKVTNITGNVHLLQGRGGNIAAINGPDGILIVDDDYRELSKKLAEALKTLGSEKPRFVLNTHWHGDHTQGNEFFGKESTIIAHTNVRVRMSKDNFNSFFNRTTPASPIHAWPLITYTESMSIHVNGDEIKLVHYPNGHTDGDTVVWFKKANVVHLGDNFFVGRFPFVDLDSNGNVQGLINNIAALLAAIPVNAKIIPGHGPLSTHADLKAYHAMLVDTSTIVQNAMKAGKTLEEIKAAGLPERYKDAGSGFIKTPQWIETIYKSYSKK